MTTSLSHSLSSTGSLSTVKEQQIPAKKDRSATITHENSDTSLTNSFRPPVEPTRFPSLTFISQNTANTERETSIKNANLKSELIENSKINKKSKDNLFNNVPVSTTVTSPTVATTHSSLHLNMNTQVPKASSINTVQTIYTDAYSNLDFDDLKSNNNNNCISTNEGEYNLRDDAHSMYQQSIYSNNLENHFPNPHYQKINNSHVAANQQNCNNYPIKEGNESFIYNDTNCIDIISLSEHKLQRKMSNGVFLNNPLAKENLPNLPNQSNNNITSNSNSNNGINPHSDLDFLDTQSISTVVTSNDVQSYMYSGKRSPATKRQLYYPNNLSVSPTYSKVRQVSQKIFSNYNNNNNILPNNTVNNAIGYTKIDLNKRFRNSLENDYFENTDGFTSNGVLEENLDDEGGEDDLNDLNEHSGFTDAESFLAKPYKKRNNFKGRYRSKISSIEPGLHEHMRRKKAMPNQFNVNSINKGNLENTKKVTRSLHEPINMKINDPRYGNYGSIKYPYFDSMDEYNVQGGPTDGGNSPHDYKSMYYRQSMFLKFILSSIYIFVMLLILCSCLKIIIMKNFNNTLVDFEVVDLDNILVSDEILLLDITSRASNVNLQDISIWDMGLDVFLVTDESNLIEGGGDDDAGGEEGELPHPIDKDITILLGNSDKFLTPLRFIGLLNLPTWSEVWEKWRNTVKVKPTHSEAQLKLYEPGKSFVYNGKELSHKQWLRILNSKYKIILRGNLKYSLPLVWQDQFISISTEIEVKPKK